MNITFSTELRNNFSEAAIGSPQNVASVLVALKDCGRSKDLESGKFVHSQAADSGFVSNIYVANTLINMYGRCGSMSDAQKIFEGIPHQSVVSWNCLIQGFVDNGQSELALEYFHRLEEQDEDGCVPDSVTYVHALSACAALASTGDTEKWLQEGKEIYSRAVMNRCCNSFVDNMLMKIFAKCGSMIQARDVFQKMVKLDVVSWNTLLQGYVENGENELALELFANLDSGASGSDCVPNARTYLAALKACAALASRNNTEWLERVKALHFKAEASNCCDVYVESALIDLYGKGGDMASARQVFDGMSSSSRNVVSWNCLLQGYVDNDRPHVALQLFQMMQTCCVPDARTFTVAFAACAAQATKAGGDAEKQDCLETGKAVHERSFLKIEQRSCSSIVLNNMLINMYSKLGRMDEAQRVFDNMIHCDLVSWNSLLQGYVGNGQYEFAMELYDRMEVRDSVTLLSALTACAALAEELHQTKSKDRCCKSLARGKAIHSECLRGLIISGTFHDVNSNHQMMFVETKLMSLYSKCGKMVEARLVFDNMVSSDALSCNGLIQGYVDNGQNEEALELISALGFDPTPETFAAAFEACGNLMAVDSGRRFEAEVKRFGWEEDLATCLVEFYGKCGCMDEAEEVFEGIAVRDVGAWNALMCGYSRKGGGAHVYDLFEQMWELNVWPNEITFTHVLAACSHGGVSGRAKQCFEAMDSKFNVRPDAIHYACMIDLFSRAANRDGALRVVSEMPFEVDVVTWTTVFSSFGK